MENNKERKRLIWAAVGVLAGVILIVVISIVLGRAQTYDGPVLTEGAPTSETTMRLANMSFLGDIVGVDGNNSIMMQLQETLTADSEAGDYIASTSGSSIMQTIYFPYTVVSFALEVSDGRIYNVQIASVGEIYYGMVVQRMAPDTGEGTFYITFLGSEENYNYNRESVISGLAGWAETVLPGLTPVAE